MKVRIRPSVPCGYTYAPPSKSYAHRLLICAGLSQGVSRIKGVSDSQDMLATCGCLREMGAKISGRVGEIEIQGTDPFEAGPSVLRCRESGSTLRFMVPVCALSDSVVRLTGEGRLMERPLSVYEDLFSESGLLLSKDGKGVSVKGPLKAGTYEIDASVSSQFISGMLFALPLVSGDSDIHLLQPVESRSYIDMTLAAMEQFGVHAEWHDEMTLVIPGGQRYRASGVTVEGDWSNAAFLLAMGAEVRGLDSDSLQGDRICEEYFRALDKGNAGLDISDCPDLGPVLMAYAALRHGAELTGTRRLRYKESDRGEAMKKELAKFGVNVDIEDDRIAVGSGAGAPSEELSGHNDHRIVMALSVMCARTGGIIDGAEAVRKSWPDYFSTLAGLGISVEEI